MVFWLVNTESVVVFFLNFFPSATLALVTKSNEHLAVYTKLHCDIQVDTDTDTYTPFPSITHWFYICKHLY